MMGRHASTVQRDRSRKYERFLPAVSKHELLCVSVSQRVQHLYIVDVWRGITYWYTVVEIDSDFTMLVCGSMQTGSEESLLDFQSSRCESVGEGSTDDEERAVLPGTHQFRRELPTSDLLGRPLHACTLRSFHRESLLYVTISLHFAAK